MAGGAAGWVHRWWRGEGGVAGGLLSLVLMPVEGAFRLVVGLRNRIFDRRSSTPPIAVISVGNLTVGGTGKTPFVRWVVQALQLRKARPAVVARGYGRDELLLHRGWNPGAPVVADRDRVRGVAEAAEKGAGVAVLDDGFQHRRLGRDLDVVLLAAETPFPGRMLPRGPYREGPSALARADVVVVTRKTASAPAAAALAGAVRGRYPGLLVGRVAFRVGPWRGLDEEVLIAPVCPVRVLTAVAQPDSVRSLTVERMACSPADVALETFPDHHEFTVEEVRDVARRSGGESLVVTEKDAVKLRAPELRAALGDRVVHVLTLDLVWEAGESEMQGALDGLLRARSLGEGA